MAAATINQGSVNRLCFHCCTPFQSIISLYRMFCWLSRYYITKNGCLSRKDCIVWQEDSEPSLDRLRLLSARICLTAERRHFASESAKFAAGAPCAHTISLDLLPLPNKKHAAWRAFCLAGAGGFEPATHGFGDRYSTS